MIKFILIALAFIASPALAQDKSALAELLTIQNSDPMTDADYARSLWQTRVKTYMAIAKQKAINDVGLWCMAELEAKDRTAPVPSCVAYRHEVSSTEQETLSLIALLEDLIQSLKQQPVNETNKDHLKVLTEQKEQLKAIPLIHNLASEIQKQKERTE